MTEGVTETSHRVYELHMLILYIVTVIAFVVFGVMCWSIFHHRKSKGAVAAQFHHSTKAEIAWTIIPILILVSMAVPATKTLIFMEQTGDADITLKVTGHQWYWKYDYLNDGIDNSLEDNISFFSRITQDSNDARQRDSGIDPNTVEHYLRNVDNPVVLPINTKIRILTTAADVIHGWWVPALGWKRDAIPGFINDNWTNIQEPGVYRGQCTELCGKDHGFMPIVVNAVTKEEYAAWVAEKKAEQAVADSGGDMSMEELMAKGEKVYATSCAACHMANGQGLEGTFPALAGSPIATGPLAAHLDRVINGKAGTMMVAFGTQLKDAELAAVITFERNSWGNDTGDVVQPADVKKAR
ncbi:MAG: cytochrome c oxidase subunit II [Proteobacteria bacterium]|nr:cytochrome c oxidase subunit II [Pseudomonadota bacterium]